MYCESHTAAAEEKNKTVNLTSAAEMSVFPLLLIITLAKKKRNKQKHSGAHRRSTRVPSLSTHEQTR